MLRGVIGRIVETRKNLRHGLKQKPEPTPGLFPISLDTLELEHESAGHGARL